MSGPEDRQPPDDHELEDFLAGRGPHHARYRSASTERTPAALDEAVLAQARAAVRASAVQRSPARRWRLPLSLAATLVLGFALVGRVHQDRPPGNAAVAPAPSAAVASVALEDRLATAPTPAPRASAKLERTPAAPPRREPPVAEASAGSAAPPPSPEAVPQALAEAAPEVALADAAPVPESQPPARKSMAASDTPARTFLRAAPAPVAAIAAGHYRSASGSALDLDAGGRFRLTATPDAPPGVTAGVLTGRWLRDGDGVALVPDAASAGECRHWLLADGADVLLRSDCDSNWVGRYRPQP